MTNLRALSLSIVMLCSGGAGAQQLALGNTPTLMTKSAVLDLNSSNQGLLLPRIADTAVINTLAPPDGMLIYFTPIRQLLVRAGGHWQPLPVAASLHNYWSTSGNANGALQQLGTTNNLALPFITNNTERMRLTAGGFLGIGTTLPSAPLHVAGTNPLYLEGVQPGSNTTADSLLTIAAGVVQKLPAGTFQNRLNGTGFVKASGATISYDNNSYTVANSAITGATKTKITYDAKGLVTGGADATTSDIAEGSNQYFTEARVRNTALTGFSTGTSTAVTATDNLLVGVGKLQGQINTINGAGYLTGNQTITLSGDITGSGTTAITTAIGANKVTLGQMAQVDNGAFLGRNTAGTGNVQALTTAQAKTLLGLTGTNSGDVTLAGQTYLSRSNQVITANAVNLSGTHVTGTLAAARFGALTGDVTNTAGSYTTTIANGAVTYAKMQNISATNRLLGRASAGAGVAEELTIGSGLSLSGTTLSANGAGLWSTTGNTGIDATTNFLGTRDANALVLRTNNMERMRVLPAGNIGIGTNNPEAMFHVWGTNPIKLTGVQAGGTTTADSVLMINAGVVQKLPVATFQTAINGTGFVKASGATISYDNNSYTVANSAITGATKTKITYDAKGLVTVGTDLTASDIPDLSATYQPLNGSLTSIGSLSGTSGYLRKTAANTYVLDNSTFLTSETDPVVRAINGLVKSNGTAISAAVAGTDYVAPNGAITGSTKTKITYDSKGLVTAGADATTSDIAEGSNQYFTQARVRATPLAGFSASTATAVTPTDDVLQGMGKLQGQINTINGAGYLTGNQTITLSGDVTGSGTTAITTAIGANKVTLSHMAQVANGTFLGRTTAGTGNVEALTTAQAKTILGLVGNNSGDVTLAGQNYLSITGQTITAGIINLSGAHATGTLAAARFGALTGDVTNTAGSYTTTIANGAVTYAKMQNVSATNRLLGRASSGAGTVEELTLGTGLSLSGTTLSANGAGLWSTTGNSGTNLTSNFLGTTDSMGLAFRTNNAERMRILATGNVGIGTTAPAERLDVSGNLRFSGALMPGGAAGTSGHVLRSNGTGTPTWVDPATLPLNTWAYGGNSVSSAQRIGTSSNYDLPFITNNTEAMRLTTGSRLGIGTTTPGERLEVAGNIKINGGDKRLVFGGMTGDPDASIGIRNTAGSEQQEMLFFVGNDNAVSWGPDRIRMVAEEFRVQSFDNAGNSNITNAESETGLNTRLYINPAGNVGVGATAFDATNPEKLLVDAGTTSSYNLIKAKGSINNYLQLNIQNSSSGTVASSDVVATADNGTETTNYIDMGINSSGFTDNTYPIISGINNAYLYSTGRNLMIGNGSGTGYKLGFFTGGTALTNERMTILGNGNVGVGTTAPTEKLDVAGNVYASGWIQSGTLYPLANDVYSIGAASWRWKRVFATDGTINTSDRRQKKNILPLSYGLHEVMSMQPVRYNWKDTAQKEAKIGLIAQDVRKLVPEVVVGDESKETLGMNYAELIPVLINAIKEQQAQIETLKAENEGNKKAAAEVADLKKQLALLLERVEQLESKKEK